MNVRDGALEGRKMEISDSSLNWMEIAYFPEPGNPDFRNACKLSLQGSGEIVFKTGRSPQVWDDFSQKFDDPHWNEVFSDRSHIGQEAMRRLFQRFVDLGLYPVEWKRKTPGEEPRPPMVRFRAKLDGENVLRTVDNRRIVRLVEDLLDPFAATARLAPGGDGDAAPRTPFPR